MNVNFTDVIDWVNKKPYLNKIIIKTDNKNLPDIDKANKLLKKISRKYKLPKTPNSITKKVNKKYENKGVFFPRSIIEEIGILNYLYPNQNVKNITLMALYNIYYLKYTDVNTCALINFKEKNKIPENYIVYYTGVKCQTKLNFILDGETWTKPGVKYALKIYRD